MNPQQHSLAAVARECRDDCRDMGWQPGDIIVSDLWPSLRRKIKKVRKTGYAYSLPEFGATTPSGNTNFFVSEDWFGWRIEETA